MRHSKLGDQLVSEVAYASFWMNEWRPIDEMERRSELQRSSTPDVVGDTPNGGVVEGAVANNHISERWDAHAWEPSLPGVSPGLQDKGRDAGQAKIVRRGKGRPRKTV